MSIRDSGFIGVVFVTSILFFASGAHAQSRSAATVAAFTAVDANGNAAPGCGGAGAGNGLTSTLNTKFGTPGFDDEAVSVGNRREYYRLCDIQTATGAQGWTGDAQASPEQQLSQSTEWAPEEMFATMDNSKSSADLQTANIARRLSVIRLSRRLGREGNEEIARSTPRPTTALAGDGLAANARGPIDFGEADRGDRLLLALQEGINGGDDADGAGIGFFLNGRVHIVDGDQNEAERGSDGFGGGFTLGVDKVVSDNLFAGVAMGYTHIDTNYGSSASESDLDAVTLALYGAYYPTDEIFIDGSVSTSYLALDTRNEVVVFDGGPPVGTLSGDTDGVNFGAEIGTGYAITIEQLEALTIEPFVRASVLYTEIDGFEQSGGDGSLNLGIRTQKATSVTGSLGLRSEYAVSTRLGVLTPYCRASYVHEFNNENDDIGAYPTAGGSAGPGFKLNAQSTDRHYANVGVGIAAILGEGLSEFIDYDVIVGNENVMTHQITAGLRLEF